MMKYPAKIKWADFYTPSAGTTRLDRDIIDLENWLVKEIGEMGVDWEVKTPPEGMTTKHLKLKFKRSKDRTKFEKEWM